MNLLNDNVTRIEWNLKSRENEILLNLISLNMIDQSINICEKAENQDINSYIKYKFYSSIMRIYNSISIISESFKHPKLSSINFKSNQNRLSDTIIISKSLSNTLDINKSSLISMIIHSKIILIQSNQNDILYFDKINIIDFLCYWNIEYKNYELIDAQKYIHIIDYCFMKIQKIIEILENYIESN